MSVLESVDFAAKQRELQMEIPGLDGYKADRLAVTFSGGVEPMVTQLEDVAFVKSLKLYQEVELKVTATVVAKGFKGNPSREDTTDDKTSFVVGLKVHSLEVA